MDCEDGRGWWKLLLPFWSESTRGVLLGTLVERPFWNNPILPMLFLVSALKRGTASVLLGGFLLRYVVVYAGQVARVISS